VDLEGVNFLDYPIKPGYGLSPTLWSYAKRDESPNAQTQAAMTEARAMARKPDTSLA